jgi:hypothetical protein
MVAAIEAAFADLIEVTATADEITAWGTLTQIDRTAAERLMGGRLQVNPNTVTTSVGLFGTDLTAFNEACAAAADTAVCDPADYETYTGWGVGVNWASSDAVTDALVDGVVFATSLWSVEVTWAAEGNTVAAGEVDSVDVDAPVDPEAVSAAGTIDPFESWGTTATDSDGPQFAYSLFEDGDDFYFEAGDTETIWTTWGSVATLGGENVENADFEFVGAASLTAATSVIVAALLF